MINKIKEQFAMLPRSEQLTLLRELSSSISENNPIIDVNSINQIQYGENIEFTITNTGSDLSPNICAELKTAWGIFQGYGQNQKIAKTTAAQLAIEHINKNQTKL